MSENPSQPAKRPFWKMKRFIVPALLFLFFFAVGATSGGSETAQNSAQNTQTGANSQEVPKENKPKEGDVLAGISRKEIDEKWNEEQKKSKLKADAYLESLKGQEVTWIAKVDNVDTNPVNNTPYISSKMGAYTVRAYDPEKKWIDLEKGNLVKITGKIDSVFSFVGLDVYVTPESIEKV